jgi:hypothetical protein
MGCFFSLSGWKHPGTPALLLEVSVFLFQLTDSFLHLLHLLGHGFGLLFQRVEFLFIAFSRLLKIGRFRFEEALLVCQCWIDGFSV